MWPGSGSPTLRLVRALMMRVTLRVAATHDRWVANGYPGFPLWIPAVIHSSLLGTALITVLQRPLGDLPWAALLVAVALSPWLGAARGRVAPAPLYWLLTGGATLALMHLHPVDYDFAPFLLVVMVGEVGACLPLLRSGLLCAATVPLILVLVIDGTLPMGAGGVWMTAIVIGWDVGFILRFQQLRVEDGERRQVEHARRAALEERQRIARDVHDLVAHSLSVTLLHLTAARRDLEDGGEVEEVVAALVDAERVGRQTMGEIRGVVGVLGQGEDERVALPGVADLPTLVDDYRAAGLDVVWTPGSGSSAEVPPATSLALYRIVQESLANVAKHAPGARALVRLDLDGDAGLLTIRNAAPRGAVRGVGGSGLRGMAERADQIGARLTAGLEGPLWTVRVVLPRAGREVPASLRARCPLPALSTIRRVVTQ